MTITRSCSPVQSILLCAVLALPMLAGAAAPGADGREMPPARGPAGGAEACGPGMAPPGAGHHDMGPPPGPAGMGGHGLHLLRGLQLSESQQDKVFALLHAQAPLLREQGKAAEKAHEALRALGRAAAYDDARAAALAQASAQAMAAIALQQVRTEQKIYALLTPEQRQQLAQDQPRRPARP